MKNRIPIKNPCKYCLKRPTCNIECEDFLNHVAVFESVIYALMLLFIFISSILLSITLCLNLSIHSALIIICTVLLCGYLYIIKDIINDINDFKSLKPIEKWLSVLFGPWLYLCTFIYYSCDIETKISKYNYRFVKHLQDWDKRFGI